jgi:outer membrane protein insertion porin family
MPTRKALRSLLPLLLLAALVFAPQTLRAAPEAAAVKIAVLPFQVNAGDDLAYLKQSLSDLLTDRFKAAGFATADPAEARNAAHGQPLQDAAGAREAARAVGATHVVYGSFSQVGEILSVDARMADVSAQSPVLPITVSKEGLINLLPALDGVVQAVSHTVLSSDVISEIDVEGTKVLDKDVILMRLSMRKGEPFSPKAVNQDLKTIYDLGYFDDVRIKVADVPGGKRVVVAVKERPRIQAIGVTGADKFSEEDITAAISTKKGAVLNPKVLSDDINVVREMYRKEGYYNAKVTHQIENSGEGQARLTFVIDEGKKLYIEKIRIEGCKSLDADDIKSGLSLKEHGMFSWFTKSGVLKEDMLERDAAYIMNYYGDHGFNDVKVGKPEVNIMEDRIEVVFRVEEGPRYRTGEIRFEGDLIADPATLAEVTRIDDLGAAHDYFSRSVVREDIKNLAAYYNNYGYAYAEVDVRTDVHRDDLVVDLIFVVSKHQKVHIRRVILEGNTKTRDNVILREMRLADGDQFSGEKLHRSTERLNKLNYFSDVDIEPVPTGDPDEMDLKVKVVDKPTGKIGGGVGYSTYDGVFFGGNIQESNLFGKGYQTGFQGYIGAKKTSYTLSFLDPRVNDSLWAMGADLYSTKGDYVYYDMDATGGDLSASYPLGEYTKLYTKYSLEFYSITDVDSDASKYIKKQSGDHIASIITSVVERDTTDKLYNPTRGTVSMIKLANGGGITGGTDEFVKTEAEHSYYQKLFGDLVFHGLVHVGYVGENFNDKEIPVTQRYFLGGIQDVRGYSYHKISPQDSSGDQMGGNKAVYTNLELIHPLNKEMGIYGVTFFDAGGAWKEGDMFFSTPQLEHGDMPPLGLYKSVGGGLRWVSPFGPLRFEYGYGIDDLYESSHHKFEFSMGQQF